MRDPELIAARQAIAAAPDKLLAIQNEALRLKRSIDLGDVPRAKATACLSGAATDCGLCATDYARKSIKEVIRMGLAGHRVGLGFTSPNKEGNRC